METVTGIGPGSSDSEHVRERCLAVSGGSWEGSSIKTRPMVSRKSGGPDNHDKSVDDLLEIFSRRVRKNGKLEEYEERQYFTQPSKERRESRREAEYQAQKRKRQNSR